MKSIPDSAARYAFVIRWSELEICAAVVTAA